MKKKKGDKKAGGETHLQTVIFSYSIVRLVKKKIVFLKILTWASPVILHDSACAI